MTDALECLCGGPAIAPHADGLFYEDEGERCLSCGHPGHVNVHTDDYEDGNYTATWWYADDCDAGCFHDADGLVALAKREGKDGT